MDLMKKVIENIKVICRDIENKLYEVSVSELTFRPSVYGVIVKEGKILLSKQWDGYDLPGGAIELGETIEQALIREVKEETGVDVRLGKIISCEDSFFKLPGSGKPVQSILIYYQCDLIGGEISTDYLTEDEKKYAGKAEWIDISKIKKIKFYNSIDSVKIIERVKLI